MHILFIAGNYPSAAFPAAGTFVREFVHAVARNGQQCTVVCPVSIFDRRHGPMPPAESWEGADGRIRLLRPRYLSFSVRNIGLFNTAHLTQMTFNQAVLRAVRPLKERPALVHGHFLYQAGYAAVQAGLALKVPSVVGTGEDSFWSVEPMGFTRAQKHFKGAAGFLAVSTLRRNELIDQLQVPPEKIRVFPNGVDQTRFSPLNKKACREAWGIPEEAFIIAFVGTFDERKGVNRLLQAVQRIKDVYLLFAGHGPLSLESSQILFKGIVPHTKIPELLSASDIFVLPTTSEGSCNALIEAMACSLPIVTSNGRYNDDIMNDKVAVRVDPLDVRQIRQAILALKADPSRREAMSIACRERSAYFDINARALRVIDWFEQLVLNHSKPNS
jgi:glycosyltransferase involved in cell wall biosynthesis